MKIADLKFKDDAATATLSNGATIYVTKVVEKDNDDDPPFGLVANAPGAEPDNFINLTNDPAPTCSGDPTFYGTEEEIDKKIAEIETHDFSDED